MARIPEQNVKSAPMSSGNVTMWLVIGWLWVGVPLVVGVSLTIYNSFPLFQGLFGGHK